MCQIAEKIKKGMLNIVNSKECTQATFYDIIYGNSEEQMFVKLEEMLEGKLTPKELRQRKVSVFFPY